MALSSQRAHGTAGARSSATGQPCVSRRLGCGLSCCEHARICRRAASSAAWMAILTALRADVPLRRSCRLTVCGEVAVDGELRSMIDVEQLPVTLGGVVSAAQLREVFDRAALLVLPGQPKMGSHAAREAACRGLAGSHLECSGRRSECDALEMPAAIGLARPRGGAQEACSEHSVGAGEREGLARFPQRTLAARAGSVFCGSLRRSPPAVVRRGQLNARMADSTIEYVRSAAPVRQTPVAAPPAAGGHPHVSPRGAGGRGPPGLCVSPAHFAQHLRGVCGATSASFPCARFRRALREGRLPRRAW